MPIEVWRTADGIGAVYTSTGVLTGEDILAAQDRLYEKIEGDEGFRYLLVDHTEVDEQNVDTESLQKNAARTADVFDWIPEGFVAIVAPSDVLFGLSRMWAALADQSGLATRVTRTRDDATAWLKGELGQRSLPFRLSD